MSATYESYKQVIIGTRWRLSIQRNLLVGPIENLFKDYGAIIPVVQPSSTVSGISREMHSRLIERRCVNTSAALGAGLENFQT